MLFGLLLRLPPTADFRFIPGQCIDVIGPNGILQGRYDVTKSSKVTAPTRGSLVVFSIAALLMCYGLIGLDIASLISARLGRIIAHFYFTKDPLIACAGEVKGSAESRKEILHTLWYNAGRLGVVQIGAVLIPRGNVLIAASFVGLAASDSYSITVTVLTTLSSRASVVCQLQLPRLAALQAANDRNAAAVLGETLLMSWLFFLVGLAFELLTVIDSKNHLL